METPLHTSLAIGGQKVVSLSPQFSLLLFSYINFEVRVGLNSVLFEKPIKKIIAAQHLDIRYRIWEKNLDS